ncbi:MAG: hypothetical protein AAF432_06730 [Planctomycetota bacterium]
MKMINPKMCTLAVTTVAAGGLLAGSAIGAGGNLQQGAASMTAAPAVQYITADGKIVDANRVARGDSGGGTPTGTTYSVDHLVGVSGGVGFFSLCDPSFPNVDNIVTFDGAGENLCTNITTTPPPILLTESVVETGVTPNREWAITLTSSVAGGEDIYPEVVVAVNGVPTTLTDGTFTIGLSDPLVWDAGLSLVTASWRSEGGGVEAFNFDFSPAFPTCWEGFLNLIVFNLGLDANGAQDLNEVGLVIVEDGSNTPEGFCPADVTGPGGIGVGNGTVNIDDLLAIINTFGANFQNPDPGTTGEPSGRPATDIVPLPCGNWVVNIDDLLEVINQFGDCPAPSGDDCDMGQIAISGTVSEDFDTTGATTDGPAHAACDQFATGADTPFNDFWYCYTADCSGRVVIDTFGSLFDTKIAVYDSCVCPTDDTNLIACNDDAGGTTQSSITVDGVTAGQMLLIRVGGFAEADAGLGTLNVVCEVPDNDNCIDAIELTIGGAAVSADNTDATLDGITEDCPGTAAIPADGGRFYKFTSANQNEITVTTCLDNANFGFSFYQTFVSVYCGGCDVQACIADSADALACGFGPFSELTFCPTVGDEYLVLIHGVDNAPLNEGFNLQVTEGAACANATQCGLDGDFCGNAFAISGDGNFPFDSSANSDTLVDGDGVNQCEFGDAQLQDVWFEWTAPTGGTALIDVCGDVAGGNPTAFDSAASAFLSCADSSAGANAIVCGDDNATACPGAFQPELAFEVTAGDTYIIVVSGWQGGGLGSLNISTLVGGITGACCVEGANLGELTEADCLTTGGPTAQWLQGEDGTFVCPSEAFAVSTCFSNGTYDDVNGTQPAAVAGGWIGSGVADDFETTGCTIDTVRVDFLDNGGASATYSVRVYDLATVNGGLGTTMADIVFSTDIPVSQDDLVVPVRDTSNIFDGDGDPANDDPAAPNLTVNRDSIAVTTGALPAGRYGLWVQATNGGSYFWATTSTGALGSSEDVVILGNDGTNDVNGASGLANLSFGIGED